MADVELDVDIGGNTSYPKGETESASSPTTPDEPRPLSADRASSAGRTSRRELIRPSAAPGVPPAAHPPAPAGPAPGAERDASVDGHVSRLAARSDELIASVRAEGVALGADFSDPRTRVWAWAEIVDWERRVSRLVAMALPEECQVLWRRTILEAPEAGGTGLPYLPGSGGWWAEYRLTRRLGELDRILERLKAPGDPSGGGRSYTAPDPMDGTVDDSSTPGIAEDAE